MSDISELKNEFKELKVSMERLTEVLIRKEENDKHLTKDVEENKERIKELEERVRKNEEYIIRVSPVWTILKPVLVALIIGAAMVVVGLKALPT